MLNVVEFATILWIAVFVFAQLLILLMLKVLVTVPRDERDGTALINQLPAEKNPGIEINESIFSIGLKEIVFNDVLNSEVYLTSTNEDTLRAVRVTAMRGNQLDYANIHNVFDQSVPKTDFSAIVINVPLALFTHVTCEAVGGCRMHFRFLTKVAKNFVARFLALIRPKLLYISCVLFLTAMVLCFYVPGAMDYQVLGANGATFGENLTKGIFVFTLLSFGIQVVSFWVEASAVQTSFSPYAKKYRSWQFKGTCVALLLIIACVGFASELLSLAVNNQSLTSSSSTTGGQSAPPQPQYWQEFTCGCPSQYELFESPSHAPTRFPTPAPTARPSVPPTATPTVAPTTRPSPLPSVPPTRGPTPQPSPTAALSPTAAPTVSPTLSPTAPPTVSPSILPTAGPTARPSKPPSAAPTQANATVTEPYSFQCVNQDLVSAGYDSCAMNCGTCGSTYRGVYIALLCCGFIEIFVLMTMVNGKCFFSPAERSVSIAAVATATHMEVTVHGSTAFGYPVTTHMSLADSLQFERDMAKLRLAVQPHVKTMAGDFLTHMHQRSSKPNPTEIGLLQILRKVIWW